MSIFEQIPTRVNTIGIKLSGGADSAIVCYMLSKYIAENRSNTTIKPITVEHAGKSYQLEFAKKIIEFCKLEFGNIFEEHEHEWCDVSDRYVIVQDNLVKRLYKENKIQCHFVGITQNPPSSVMNQIGWNGPADDRSAGVKRPLIKGSAYFPLINTNKQGVCNLYKEYNVLDTLFPLTRSCENFTEDYSVHCGECWFCKERYWGFGKYV